MNRLRALAFWTTPLGLMALLLVMASQTHGWASGACVALFVWAAAVWLFNWRRRHHPHPAHPLSDDGVNDGHWRDNYRKGNPS